MMHVLRQLAARVDWILVAAMLPLLAAGLVTMHSFTGESYFFTRQLMWIGISFAVFFVFALVDWRFLRRTWIVVTLYLISLASLILVLLIGDVTLGAQSRFNLGPIAVQPADPAKLVTIILLAKYFTRRHIEIANIKHILVSGFYAFTLFALVFLQPDFGSAIIIAAIWFGMVLVSGISKKHLAGVLLIGIISAIGLWFFGLEDYQKERIMTFLHPYTDVQGTGYNAYQSTIAVGSGQVLGKGLGYGTQSRLEFLPEYETDFIFAAFAEEWGFVGVLILFSLFGIVIWRILDTALYGATNFEVLFGVGVATLFMSHFVIHVGMNVGLLPVTGTTIPLLSYGGSHLVTEFAALGMLMGMRAYRRTLHRDHLPQELVGV
jgi:rod shape determining protein RodA